MDRCLVGVAAALVLAGCGMGGSSTGHSPSAASASETTSTRAHVVATLDVTSPNQAVVTQTGLWLLGGPSGVITQVDPATNTITRVVTPPYPVGFGTYAPPFLWVASFMNDVLMQLDAETGQVLRTIKRSPAAPWDGPVGLESTGTDLWVVNHNSATLVRLDPVTGAVDGTTKLPGHKAGGPMVAAGSLWIAMTKSNLVVRVNPTTGQVDGDPIHLDTGACAASSAAGGDLWYTSVDAEDVGCHDGTRRLDPLTGTVSPIDYGAGMSTFADFGSEVWASDRDHTLYRVDVASGTLTPTVSLPGGAASNRLTSAFGSLWVLRPELNQLVRIEAGS
jgi:streptogramin lyase